MGFERRRSISCEISIRFVAMHMVESGPSRHLMRRSDLAAIGANVLQNLAALDTALEIP